MTTLSQLNFQCFLVAVLSLSIAAGCNPPGPASSKTTSSGHDHDHDHDHDAPKTIAEALKAVDGFATDIKKAFEADKPDDAHDALHEIGHSLEALEGLAAKEIKDTEALTTAKAAMKVLFDAYGALDEGMHGGKGKKYEDVAKEIDDSLSAIKKLLPIN